MALEHLAADALPEQPALRPGTPVTRRDEHRLQVGIDAPHRVVVPDLPVVRRLLDALAQGRAVPRPDERTWPVLRRLGEADLLVDAPGLAAATARGAAARAAWAQFGSGAAARVAARSSARVGVLADDDAAAQAGRLLRECGVGVGSAEAADVWLVVSDDVSPRAPVDRLVQQGVPHLLVGPGPRSVLLGPFVLPGVTACLRCLDAHRSADDPHRALVVEQVAARPGLPHRDPALLALALAWAVRDLLRFVEGDEPSTWSTTVELGPLAVPAPRAWTRHPHCGCSWDDTLLDRVTG